MLAAVTSGHHRARPLPQHLRKPWQVRATPNAYITGAKADRAIDRRDPNYDSDEERGVVMSTQHQRFKSAVQQYKEKVGGQGGRSGAEGLRVGQGREAAAVAAEAAAEAAVAPHRRPAKQPPQKPACSSPPPPPHTH